MSSPKPRVTASLVETVRHSKGAPDYQLKVMIDYAVLVGTTHKAAKYPITIIGAKNEADVRDMIKHALVDELNERWPADVYQVRDIMLFGI